MVVLNRIYTRTGDDGTTSLGSGARRKKYDLRVEAYGTVDEVNAVIGLVRLHTGDDVALDKSLGRMRGGAGSRRPTGGGQHQKRRGGGNCQETHGSHPPFFVPKTRIE